MKKPKTEDEACKLIHELESEFKLHVIIWAPGDVRMRAKEMKKEISEKEVEDIMYSMGQNHDANDGTTWETIDYLIEDIIRYRPDPRIAEFTARIDEAEDNMRQLREIFQTELADEIQSNVKALKQQRDEIIKGVV